ncbi:MAG TPA: DUF368 domain-containing protein [Chitinophagaceae bacterium]|nr:DUF368 domain-containing protein [Chitinophagaceae bacterium]
MNKHSFLQNIILFLKGLAMGAADVVPGVSGGTIAFVVGIYEELLETIDKLNFSFFKVWKKDGIRQAWKQYNLQFLVVLGAGIVFSIISLAKAITYLLGTYPIMVWAFFFGLILASIFYIIKQMNAWKFWEYIACIITAIFAYFLTLAKPLGGAESYFFFFLAGFFGIIAMILPGISGAFILLLIGAYLPVLDTLNSLVEALKQRESSTIIYSGIRVALFIIGMITGLKVFSKVLTYLFNNFKNITFAVLTGFMIGSLNKIWPWKEVIETRINSKGEEVPLLEKSVLPAAYNSDPNVLLAIICMVLGLLLILSLEFFASKKGKIN